MEKGKKRVAQLEEFGSTRPASLTGLSKVRVHRKEENTEHARSLISDVCQSALSLEGSFPEATLASFSKDYSRLPHYVLAAVSKTNTVICGRE